MENISPVADYRYQIAASPILFKIRKTAISVFNGWMANVKNEEKVLNFILNNRCENEDRVAIDFSECLSSAIHTMKNMCKTRKITHEWASGFVCGFMEETLGEKWSSRYIKSYKSSIKNYCPAIRDCFKKNEIEGLLVACGAFPD